MTRNEEAKATAEAIGLVLRQLALTSQYAFDELWSEVAAGHETYGKKNLLWTSFVREHNTAYWQKRIASIIRKRRAEGTL